MRLMNPNEIANASINMKAIEALVGYPVSPMILNPEDLGSHVMNPNEIYNTAINLKLITGYHYAPYTPPTGVFKALDLVKTLLIVGGLIVAAVALFM